MCSYYYYCDIYPCNILKETGKLKLRLVKLYIYDGEGNSACQRALADNQWTYLIHYTIGYVLRDDETKESQVFRLLLIAVLVILSQWLRCL